MKNYFYMGGTLFMSILTILFILMVAWAIINLLAYLGNTNQKDFIRKRLVHVKSIGLLAIITGVLGQLVGLHAAFIAIAEAADISPALVFEGLKVSMIPTIYGFLIYIISLIVWIMMDVFLLGRKGE